MNYLDKYFSKEEFVKFEISAIKEELFKLYQEGYSMVEISNKLKISLYTAFVILGEIAGEFK